MATKKITFNMLEVDMPREEPVKIRFGTDDKFEISVKKTLNVLEALQFVRSVAEACVNVDTGVYTPELFDFAVKVNTLTAYAGITGFEAKKIEKVYRVIYGSDIFNRVFQEIDHTQYNVLARAAKERVEFSAKNIVSANSRKLGELITRMDNVMTSGQEMLQEFNSEEFREKLAQAARSIGAEPPKADVADPDNLIVFD